MTSVLLVAHHERADAALLARRAATWLHEGGHRAWLMADDAAALGMPDLAGDAAAAEADLVLALGGDGTVLRAVEMLGGACVPVLAVNVGVLGYLAEVEPDGMVPALEHVLAGSHEVEERMLLEVRVGHQVWRALNEAVFEKSGSTHTVRLGVSINDTRFTSYVADGLIVATPTGSTAYSLSARGPIVSPRHRAMLLTPVSPHMLFDRCLVLDPEERVEIEVGGHRPVALSVDGRLVATLEEGERVQCRASPDTAQFVRFGGREFHQILKAKFGLSDR